LKSLTLRLCCGTALWLIAQPGLAQSPDNSAAAEQTSDNEAQSATPLKTTRRDDGSIIVTARRYVPDSAITANKSAIPLIQTPQSISVVTRDQIDLLAFVDAQQAVRYVAGVFGENYGSDPRYDFITVRGFNPKQYIDGLAVPATTTINSVGLDLYAFQSLDILKGPSSTLYGNAPPGGIYNLTSRRASSEFGGELQAKYGTHDFKQFAGTVTGAVNDWLDVRFTGLYRDRDDEIDHLHAKRLMVAPTATIKIGTSTKITPLLYYQYDTVDGGNGGFLPEVGTLLDNPNGLGRLPRSTNLGDPNNQFERRQWGAGLDIEQKLGSNLTFRSNTKWSHYKEVQTFGLYDQGGYTNTTNPLLPSYYTTISQSDFPNQEEITSFATDNRLEANIATGAIRHKILVGVDYRNVMNVAGFGFNFGTDTLNAYNPVYVGDSITPTSPSQVAFNDQRLRQTGVYGQDQINFGQLFVTLGGRYDWVKIDNYLYATKGDQHKFTWRAGANYVTNSGLAPYVSYSTSFEPVLGIDTVTKQPYKPTSGHQWEGGVKYDARGLSHDVKLFATAAVFDIVQSNVVTTGSQSLIPLTGTQAGKVEVYGAEFELVARIMEQLSINASYSYTHSRVKESAVPVEIGAELPTTPKHKVSLFADYTFARGPLAGFGAGFGGRYTARSAGALPSLAFGTNALVPAIIANKSTLFDAILHYDLPGWRIAVNGSNLFDKKYVARCSGVNSCFYGAGRQIIGTVTKKF
jgi:iron complex outermembrane receptor protein